MASPPLAPLALLAVLALARMSAASVASSTSSDANFELVVLHTNDLHSRFDEISGRGSACRPKDADRNKCYGGVARIKHAADAMRLANADKTVFLNAGDFFQVTIGERFPRLLLPRMRRWDAT